MQILSFTIKRASERIILKPCHDLVTATICPFPVQKISWLHLSITMCSVTAALVYFGKFPKTTHLSFEGNYIFSVLQWFVMDKHKDNAKQWVLHLLPTCIIMGCCVVAALSFVTHLLYHFISYDTCPIQHKTCHGTNYGNICTSTNYIANNHTFVGCGWQRSI